MANLVITRSCVRHCPYCFASEYMDKADACMSWDDYIYALDFMARSKVDAVAVMGGEPSLHPHFVEFIEYALLRLKHARTLTADGSEIQLYANAEMSAEVDGRVRNAVARRCEEDVWDEELRGCFLHATTSDASCSCPRSLCGSCRTSG